MITFVRLLPLFVFFLFGSTAFAEGFGVVRDPDGWVNVRKSDSLNAEVVGRIDAGELVWIFEDKGNQWLMVAFRKGYTDESGILGFVHASRIKKLDAMEEAKGTADGEQRMIFSNGDLRVEVESQPFDASEVAITKTQTTDAAELVTRINGRPFWGADGGLPRTSYRSIVVKSGDEILSMPKEAHADLYEPNLSDDLTQVFRDPDTGAIYITAVNSDGAGAYAVGFRVENGKYAGRTVLLPF